MTDKERQAFIDLTEVVDGLNKAIGGVIEAFERQNEINAKLLCSIIELRKRVEELEENSTLQE
jgi:hypothetical protein